MNRYDRSLFKDGNYLLHFRPEESDGPFTEIYRQKLNDVLSLIEGEDWHILDVGGGMGRMSLPLSQGNDVLVCDISSHALERAVNPNAARLCCVTGDAHDLPIGDSLFDYVIAIDLLVHLRNPGRALGEFARLLRPGGKLIIDSTNSNPLWTVFFPSYVGRSPSRWTRVLLHGGVLPEWQSIVRHYRKRQFIELLEDAGFVVLRQFSYGPRIFPKWNLVLATKTGGARHNIPEDGRWKAP